MHFFGEVDFDCTLKSELCELPVLGTNDKKIKVDLSIVEKKGKVGVVQAEKNEWQFEEGYYICEYILFCEYDEIEFLRTASGTGLLIRKNNKTGFYTLTATSEDKNSHIFCDELFPCVYNKIEYVGGYPAYFNLYKENNVMKYNVLTKEMTLEMRKKYD